jgi:hypothetical protein
VRRAQRGVTLLAMLAILVGGAAWFMVSAVSTPIDRTATERVHNARILQEAKTALVGYVAQQAAMNGENDPGALPCPEAAGNIGTANEGIASGNCTLPAIGRLPWRTLGLDKWRDAAGEPLWYVVSPGWAKPNAATNTVINSDVNGQLTLDATGDVVALIIAPGRPLNVMASANCVARLQARTTPSAAIDFRDYLECQNANSPIDTVFASSGPAGSFNDQVLSVTGAELLPAIESAVGTRFVREWSASMPYCGAPWPACAATVYFPFAANFAGDPALSTFQGTAGVTQGLLPLSFSGTGACQANTPVAPFCAPPAACNPALDTRCAPTLVTYRNNPTITQTGGSAFITPPFGNFACAAAGTPNTLTCTINAMHLNGTAVADRWVGFTLALTSNNVALALRQINAAVQITGVDTTATGVNVPLGYSVNAAAINADGSATVTITSRLPAGGGTAQPDLTCLGAGWEWIADFVECRQHTITVPFMWVDQPLLYATNATSAWYYRNLWHQRMYYAVSAGNAPSGAGTCAGATCLSVSGVMPANAQRAIAIIPGRQLLTTAPPQARPPVVLTDWLENENANPVDGTFWARHQNSLMNRNFNDRVSVIGSN